MPSTLTSVTFGYLALKAATYFANVPSWTRSVRQVRTWMVPDGSPDADPEALVAGEEPPEQAASRAPAASAEVATSRARRPWDNNMVLSFIHRRGGHPPGAEAPGILTNEA